MNETPAVPFPRCTYRLWEQAHPRTCQECGLGPCKAGLKPPSAAAEPSTCPHLPFGPVPCPECHHDWLAQQAAAETPEILLWLVQYKDEWCAAYPTKRQAEVYACGFSHPELITILEGRFRQTSSATLGDTP